MGEAKDDEGDRAERQADLAQREAGLAAHLETIQRILDAAEERDTAAETRDQISAERDHVADQKAFTSPIGNNGYVADLPAPRHAAMDRRDAKGDRTSSADDRAALAKVADDLEGDDDVKEPEKNQSE